ncbi:MAG: peptidylprolyl isomerase [Desulfobacterales bacterium]
MKIKITLLLLFSLLAGSFLQAAETRPQVRFETTLGAIVLELDAQAAPQTVANFLGYVREGFYDGLIFHRVIKGFMIQGGGMTPDMAPRPTHAPIPNEAANGLQNRRGSVAMARTADPHSATAQFFINTVDNPFLDHRAPSGQGWGYCVFGQVVAGMDVVAAIENAATGMRAGHGDVPETPIVIQKALLEP